MQWKSTVAWRSSLPGSSKVVGQALRLSWEAQSLLQWLLVPLAWHEAGRVSFEGGGNFQGILGACGHSR